MSYIKMSELVGQEFTITEVKGYNWKLWDDVNKQMLFSNTFEKGYQKRWSVVTNKGDLEISKSQMAECLEGVSDKGQSNIIGKTFSVRSNGKEGKEIRYYINPIFKRQLDGNDTPFGSRVTP